jgi:Zn-dependent M28 family amino/carboxypeptidase
MNIPESSPRRRRRTSWFTLGVALGVFVGLPVAAWWALIHMPGENIVGPLPALDTTQEKLADELRRDVTQLATTIGERNLFRHPQALEQAADYVAAQLTEAGYTVERQTYDARGSRAQNLVVEQRGTTKPDEIVVIGAHYDSALGTPGANDNGSGVASMLALARRAAKRSAERTVRFVAFTNEEQPYFTTSAMGSRQYASRCRQANDNIVAMLSLETMGYFNAAPGSQKYPPPMDRFYPDTGNFIGVVGNIGSRQLVQQVVDILRRSKQIPTEGGALPAGIDGVGWSDHSSFWDEGYRAVMITDTALFRYPYYHTAQDTPDKIDFAALARVTTGLGVVLDELAGRK